MLHSSGVIGCSPWTRIEPPMAIASDYSQLMQSIDAKLPIPPVRDICIAPFESDPAKSSKFGALVLADGTVGRT